MRKILAAVLGLALAGSSWPSLAWAQIEAEIPPPATEGGVSPLPAPLISAAPSSALPLLPPESGPALPALGPALPRGNVVPTSPGKAARLEIRQEAAGKLRAARALIRRIPRFGGSQGTWKAGRALRRAFDVGGGSDLQANGVGPERPDIRSELAGIESLIRDGEHLEALERLDFLQKERWHDLSPSELKASFELRETLQKAASMRAYDKKLAPGLPRGLLDLEPDARLIHKRALRQLNEDPSSVVGMLSTERIELQKFGDCGVRAVWNQAKMRYLHDLLTYDQFLALAEKVIRKPIRASGRGINSFDQEWFLGALGIKIEFDPEPRSESDLVQAIRKTGGALGLLMLTNPETGKTSGHWVALNGAIQDGGRWHFIVTDSNYSRPRIFSYPELKLMGLSIQTLQPEPNAEGQEALARRALNLLVRYGVLSSPVELLKGPRALRNLSAEPENNAGSGLNINGSGSRRPHDPRLLPTALKVLGLSWIPVVGHVAAHEFGHFFVARLLGVRVREVSLFRLKMGRYGGIYGWQGYNLHSQANPSKILAIALAGPAFGALYSAASLAATIAFFAHLGLTAPWIWMLLPYAAWLNAINLALCLGYFRKTSGSDAEHAAQAWRELIQNDGGGLRANGPSQRPQQVWRKPADPKELKLQFYRALWQDAAILATVLLLAVASKALWLSYPQAGMLLCALALTGALSAPPLMILELAMLGAARLTATEHPQRGLAVSLRPGLTAIFQRLREYEAKDRELSAAWRAEQENRMAYVEEALRDTENGVRDRWTLPALGYNLQFFSYKPLQAYRRYLWLDAGLDATARAALESELRVVQQSLAAASPAAHDPAEELDFLKELTLEFYAGLDSSYSSYDQRLAEIISGKLQALYHKLAQSEYSQRVIRPNPWDAGTPYLEPRRGLGQPTVSDAIHETLELFWRDRQEWLGIQVGQINEWPRQKGWTAAETRGRIRAISQAYDKAIQIWRAAPPEEIPN